jgi:hypothetical protein
MGNIGGAISGTVGAISGTVETIGNVGGAIGGAVTGNKSSGSKLDGDDDKHSKRNASRVAKGSSKQSAARRSKASEAAGVGISAYDADRDRRRYL